MNKKRFQKLAGILKESLTDFQNTKWTSTNTNQSFRDEKPGDEFDNNAYADKLNRDFYFAKEKEKQESNNSFANLEQAKETARKLSIKNPNAFYIVEKNKSNNTFFIIKQQRRHHRFPGLATYKNGAAK